MDYIYLPPGMKMHAIRKAQDVVILYERPENHGNKGTNVAFLDGHVEWMDMAKFQDAMEKTQKILAESAKGGK